jgi:glycosyltransferase involved in cell wall biosynthesis
MSVRIAIFTAVLSRHYGVARVIAAQLPYLTAQGWVVDIFSCTAENPVDLCGARLVRIPTHLRGVAAMLGSAHYDVVIAHTHAFYSLLPLLGKECITIAYEHGMAPAFCYTVAEQKQRERLLADRDAAIFSRITRVVTISQFAARHIAWPSAYVLYNGADHLTGFPERLAVRATTDQLQLLCVSRFGAEEQKYKGLEALGKLARELGDGFCITLLGTGPALEKRNLEGLGLTVLDFQDDAMLAECYRACDALVSLSTFENFNLPLGEAGFFHKPALALDVGAHREVTPFCFADYGALRDFLRNSSRESLRADGEKMFAFVDARFRWEYNGQGLVRLLTELAPGGVSGRGPGAKARLWVLFWQVREAVRRIYKRWVRHG